MAFSRSTFLLCLLQCCIPSLSGQAEMSFSYNHVSIRLLGRSGRVIIRPNALADEHEDRTVWLEMNELQEFDDSSQPIGRYSSPRHFYNKFSQVDFEFTPRINTLYRDDMGSEFPCTNVNMSSSFYDLGQGVKVTVMIYVFGEDGVLTNENEKLRIGKGSVKVNFQIEGWPFCTRDCGERRGEYLQLRLELRSSMAPRKMRASVGSHKRGDQYDLGNGNRLLLATKVRVDGNVMDMPQYYPMHNASGNRQYFLFRFPRFTNNIFYDPVIEINPPSAARSTSASTSHRATGGDSSSALISFIFVLIALLLHAPS